MNDKVKVTLLIGELLEKLSGWQPPQTLDSGHRCPEVHAMLSDDDLKDYVAMTEHIHAFELLKLYEFLTAPSGSRKPIANGVASKLALSPGPDERAWSGLPTDRLKKYLNLSDTIRTFGMIALYRFFENTPPGNTIVEYAMNRVKDFHSDVSAILGPETCRPFCDKTGLCGSCDLG